VLRFSALALVGGLFLAGTPMATAQQSSVGGPFTVDELVARALGENPELAAARAEVEAGRGRLRQAGLRPNPMLDLAGQQNVSGPDSNVSVGVTVPLDLNGRKEGRVGVATREVELKLAQLADRERRLTADVRLKAGEIFAASRNLAFTEQLLSVNRQGLGLVQERVRQGGAPALEENLLLVEVNRLDAARQLLESRAEILRLQLKALVGLPPEGPLALRGELEAPAVWSERATAITRALTGRPDIRAARSEAAMARARIQKEEAEGRWDMSLNVGYQRQDTGFPLSGITDRGGTRPIQDTFHMVGGGVTIILPVRNRNQGNIKAAQAETEAAERRREFLELVVRQEITSAFTQYEAARRSLDIYGRGVREVGRQNLEVVRQSYGLGRLPLLEVIGEQRRYIEVESGYTESLKQVYDAAVEIERAIGAAP
jgi:cobalt-zinc-cadmium efflux system outer membrane protein